MCPSGALGLATASADQQLQPASRAAGDGSPVTRKVPGEKAVTKRTRDSDPRYRLVGGCVEEATLVTSAHCSLVFEVRSDRECGQ